MSKLKYKLSCLGDKEVLKQFILVAHKSKFSNYDFLMSELTHHEREIAFAAVILNPTTTNFFVSVLGEPNYNLSLERYHISSLHVWAMHEPWGTVWAAGNGNEKKNKLSFTDLSM